MSMPSPARRLRRARLVRTGIALALLIFVLVPGVFGARSGEAGTITTPGPAAPVPAVESESPGDSPLLAPAAAPRPRLRYVFPVQPSRATGYSPGGHAYPATDIFAPFGSRFVAVTSGVIESVQRVDEWDRAVNDGANRGGRWVALIGDDGIRYYGSHLSRIALYLAPGDRVGAGQVLGYVGVAGNARDTPPHVHFGISCPSEPDDWQARVGQFDPVPYLDDWRAGVSSSPADRYRCDAR